jgi:spermidine synthase
MSLDQSWFSEPCEPCGSAISLKLKQKVHEEQSPYQRLEIYETTTFGHLMVIDGCVMLTQRDNFIYHEMMAHPALHTHPDPRRVLIIGGGDCGTLREVLKHRTVQEVAQVDIDERVTRLAERYFPELCESNGDPRAHLHFQDGIAWVASAEAGHYDLIIVDSTDPVGPAEGLFREPFYRDCRRALGSQGILVQQSESPLLHVDLIREMRAGMLRAGFAAVQTLHFPQPTYPSGWWSATLAHAAEPPQAWRAPEIATRYYTEAVHRGALALPAFLQKALG